jgi:Membrane MotB of proton-channel complex MotA/MotB
MISLLLRKKKAHVGGGGPDANAWMVSYADMATILLAMFIVLSTFSQDQTGITLYHGTGSFKKGLKNFGLPGLSPNSTQTVPLNHAGPQHSFDPAEGWKPKEHTPDAPDRVIDVEEEHFQHFLDEIGRVCPLNKLRRTVGQVTVDMHEPLSPLPPYLTVGHRLRVLPLLALLQRERYHLQIVVWAGMPVDTALIRASTQANAIVEMLAAGAELSPAERARLIGIGRTWPYRDIRRPVLSVVITRTE